MSKKSKKSNQQNIGPRVIAIFFIFIMIYISAFVIMYMTKEKVDIHEVETGSINANNTYTGIALRKEEVYYSEFAGNVNYFVGEGQRAAVGSVVYTVDETGRVAAMIESLNDSDNSMSANNMATIKNALSSYKTTRSDLRFYEIYEVKDKLEQVVTDAVNENIVKNLDDIIKDTGSMDLFKYAKSDKTGIVVYNTDGYEGLSVEQLTKDHFNKDNYVKTNLRTENIIGAQSPVYKLITDEMWEIVIPLTNEQIAQQGLADKKNVRIRFVKEDITTYANFSIVPTSSGTYGVLSLNKFMVQFATDRFIDVEIISSSASGLKIPVSAIVEKEFFTIPVNYATKGGNQSSIGFLKEHADSSGKIITEYCTASVYAEIDGMYYVDKSEFSYGDTIIAEDSSQMYSLTTVGSLQGVYVVNKGYAVFRKIEVIEQNEEYAIASKGVAYGVSVYDHIVLDGTKVEENQIIY